MIFNRHFNLVGKHAFLGASQYHWINYDEDKLRKSWASEKAKIRGTELHAFAEQCIRLRQKLPDEPKTLNMYVNDAIGFKMKPEQRLYYSDNIFGTADAISLRDDFLRLHDFKSGVSGHMEQLLVYTALFCLEYDYRPNDIGCELRLYKDNKILVHNPTIEDIAPIMDRIITFDKIINEMKEEEKLL